MFINYKREIYRVGQIKQGHLSFLRVATERIYKIKWFLVSIQEVKVIWQKAPHGGPIPRLEVTPGGRNLYHWIPGVGVPISVP